MRAFMPMRGIYECADGVLTTVPAGSVCTSECTGASYSDTSELARIHFPIQQYTQGFCPEEALERGTLFPELVK